VGLHSRQLRKINFLGRPEAVAHTRGWRYHTEGRGRGVSKGSEVKCLGGYEGCTDLADSPLSELINSRMPTDLVLEGLERNIRESSGEIQLVKSPI